MCQERTRPKKSEAKGARKSLSTSSMNQTLCSSCESSKARRKVSMLRLGNVADKVVDADHADADAEGVYDGGDGEGAGAVFHQAKGLVGELIGM